MRQNDGLFLLTLAATAGIMVWPVVRHDPMVGVVAAAVAMGLGRMLRPLWKWRFPVLAAMLTTVGTGAVCGAAFAIMMIADDAWKGEVHLLGRSASVIAGMTVMGAAAPAGMIAGVPALGLVWIVGMMLAARSVSRGNSGCP